MRMALVVIGIVAVGLVGALASTVLSNGDKPPVSEAPPAPRDEGKLSKLAADMEDLQAQLKTLRAEVSRWNDRPALLAAAPEAAGIGVPPPSADIPAGTPAEEIDVPLPDELARKIIEVVEEREREQREVRERRDAARNAEREARMLERIAEKLELTPNQREDLARIRADRRRAFTALWAQARERAEQGEVSPEDRAALGAEFQRIREESDTQIQLLLSPEQYETYRKLDSGRGSRGPRGRGGPGRRGR